MRRTLSALVIASLAVSLTGCGAGHNAATRQVRQVTDGVEASITKDGNDIKVVNLLVVAAPGGNAVLVGTVVNNADKEDALLGVAINGSTATYSGKANLPLRLFLKAQVQTQRLFLVALAQQQVHM